MKKICVLGLGYIGLPTASMFALHGIQVVGVDVNSHIIQKLNHGEIHIEETGLKEAYRSAVYSGNLIIKSLPEPADAFIIAVPTPMLANKRADMRAVISATESIVPYLSHNSLVVLESTSPPQTTLTLVKPILERSGLIAGKDFFLVYSPERVLPGNILRELVENARVIGGVNRESAEEGRKLYSAFVKGEILLTDATTAEMVKLMENTYRDVNIALANEFALLAEQFGINVWEAISLANRHPRVKILKPGPGVGGHCIAIDPWFLVEAAPDIACLIHKARLINDGMPEHVIQKVYSLTKGIDQAKIACLGLTYKADVDDIRESPAFEIVRRLKAQNHFEVQAYDPYVKNNPELGNILASSLEEAISGADLLLVLVDHSEFKRLLPEQASTMRNSMVLDTRGCLDGAVWRSSGYEIAQLGVAN